MHALIVYAHPKPTSFTAALKDTAVDALRGAGHTVDVSDLYAEGFNPVAGRHDFVEAFDPNRFHYQTEQGHAHATHGFTPEITREQERFLKADLMIWVYPIWGRCTSDPQGMVRSRSRLWLRLQRWAALRHRLLSRQARDPVFDDRRHAAAVLADRCLWKH